MRDALSRMTVVLGDITQQRLDAIVNAANEHLAPGGGVCGAIHRAAGPELADACAVLGGCRTGDAKVTEGFRLPARWVVHAVGPVWHGGQHGEPALLASTYRRSLEQAMAVGARTIGFPAISTGIFGYPADQAADVAVETVASVLAGTDALDEVRFVCFGDESARLHQSVLERLSGA